jgi:hypothetical protein
VRGRLLLGGDTLSHDRPVPATPRTDVTVGEVRGRTVAACGVATDGNFSPKVGTSVAHPQQIPLPPRGRRHLRRQVGGYHHVLARFPAPDFIALTQNIRLAEAQGSCGVPSCWAGVSSTGDTVSGGALSARAMARLVAVFAVLAGLFAMHGLSAQGCPGGIEASAPSMAMAHPARVVTAVDGFDMAAGMAVSASHPLAYAVAEAGADAGESGVLCVSTPPPPGWAGLLALLLGVGVVGLASILGLADRATRPSGQRRRAPPLAGSALLMNLCVSRR